MSDDYQAHPRPGGRPPVREPAFNVPGVVLAVIAVLAAIHALRTLLPDGEGAHLMLSLAFIPARLTVFFDPSRAQELFESAFAGGGMQMALTRFVLTEGPAPWSVVTYGLLHGSWMHLGFNALWLLAFGTPVAWRFGVARFLLLFLAATVAGSLFYWLMRPVDVTPMVGASGAISGVMAAAARFVFGSGQVAVFGRSTPSVLFAPAQPLVNLLENRQALGFIIAWLVINLIAGFASGAFGVDGAIAWEAHIGGFLAGLALFRPLDPVPPAARRS
ncbi:rhomboid family intramembrane serine protease [Pseudochelatococcus sp. B33]